MTAEEALHAVQAALRDHGLPGGVGLREADRTFIFVLAPDDLPARPAVAELLEQMGCEVSVNGSIYGKVTGRLLPAPPLPPVHVRASDTAHAAEGATVADVTGMKRCAGAGCLAWLPVEAFIYLNVEQGRRCSYCVPCERARQKRARAARLARVQVRLQQLCGVSGATRRTPPGCPRG